MENKSIAVLLSLVLIVFVACDSSKKTTDISTSSNMKAFLIDGTWEANYIMNLPKSFAELFSKAIPTVTFNSIEDKVNGNSGCNNFNGKVEIVGNKIKFGESLAVTKKMCPDMTGEEAFLETLKKANSYSVTEQGKTLNLIMGDIAVMRLSRKSVN